MHLWEPYEGLNSLVSLLSHSSPDVRTGAVLGVGLVNCGVYNKDEDLALNTLFDTLSMPVQPSMNAAASHSYCAALLALALAYARTGREDLTPFILKGLREGNNEVCATAALAGGLIFCGQRQREMVEEVKKKLAAVNADTEDQLTSLVLGFAFALQFAVRGSSLTSCVGIATVRGDGGGAEGAARAAGALHAVPARVPAWLPVRGVPRYSGRAPTDRDDDRRGVASGEAAEAEEGGGREERREKGPRPRGAGRLRRLGGHGWTEQSVQRSAVALDAQAGRGGGDGEGGQRVPVEDDGAGDRAGGGGRERERVDGDADAGAVAGVRRQERERDGASVLWS